MPTIPQLQREYDVSQADIVYFDGEGLDREISMPGMHPIYASSGTALEPDPRYEVVDQRQRDRELETDATK